MARLTDPQIEQIKTKASLLDLAQQHHLAGIIATNTTIAKDQLATKRLDQTGNLVVDEAGGISGAPVRQRSTDVIRYIYQKTNGHQQWAYYAHRPHLVCRCPSPHRGKSGA